MLAIPSALARTLLIGALALVPPGLWGQEVRRAQVNGTALAYRDVGTGDPLVLLHGFQGSGAQWDPVVPDLAARYRLIIPDLRGHGASAPLDGPFLHRDAAADILALMDRLGLDRVRAMGFSSGSMTLLHLATTEPHRVARLVLVAGAPYLPEAARVVMRGLDPDAIPMAGMEAMGLVHGDTARARALMREFVGFQDSYRDVNFTPPLLSTITAPTLIVHGDGDILFPLEIPLALHSAIADSELLIFPGHGHEPWPEDPAGRDYFVSAVLRFLAPSD